MINLYRQGQTRSKGKTLYAANRSHTASMHLRTSTDKGVDENRRGGVRESARHAPNDSKSRSNHKYKKSLVLQDTTIQLVKRSSERITRGKETGMSTDRHSRGRSQKRSVDLGLQRLKTDMEDGRSTIDSSTVQIGVQDLRHLVGKMRTLRQERQQLGRELSFWRKEMGGGEVGNSALRALGC